jgi:hypothetical protein
VTGEDATHSEGVLVKVFGKAGMGSGLRRTLRAGVEKQSLVTTVSEERKGLYTYARRHGGPAICWTLWMMAWVAVCTTGITDRAEWDDMDSGRCVEEGEKSHTPQKKCVECLNSAQFICTVLPPACLRDPGRWQG